MSEIFVIVEHRLGETRDITFEMLWKAGELAEKLSHTVTAIILGHDVKSLAENISDRADKIIVFDDERLKNFNADIHKEIIYGLIEESKPALTLIGNTSWVSGKIFANVSFAESQGCLLTIRSGVFPKDKIGDRKAEIIQKDYPFTDMAVKKSFVEFVETAAGDVDITQADLLVSVGRGIGEEENISLIKEFAEALGGVVSCSRPIVDKNWLPKYLQVGTSGKTVSPKVYIAVGISGAFQHMAPVGQAQSSLLIKIQRLQFSGRPIMVLLMTCLRLSLF